VKILAKSHIKQYPQEYIVDCQCLKNEAFESKNEPLKRSYFFQSCGIRSWFRVGVGISFIARKRRSTQDNQSHRDKWYGSFYLCCEEA